MTPRHNRVIIRPSLEGFGGGGLQNVPLNPTPIFSFKKIIRISSKTMFKKQEKERNVCMFDKCFVCIHLNIE